MRSSMVPPMMKRVTWMGLNCPSLWMRSCACCSTAGFHLPHHTVINQPSGQAPLIETHVPGPTVKKLRGLPQTPPNADKLRRYCIVGSCVMPLAWSGSCVKLSAADMSVTRTR